MAIGNSTLHRQQCQLGMSLQINILEIHLLIVEYICDFRRPGSSASNASSDVNYRPPSLPGKSSMKATMAAARQQQILHQYNAAAQGSPQHQQQHQQNAANQISNLPDFTVSKNDMSKSASQFKSLSNNFVSRIVHLLLLKNQYRREHPF